jgi:hypothetical protein
MLHNQSYRLWRVVAQCLSGSMAIVLLTFVCFRLRPNLATTAFLYLIIIVLVSLHGVGSENSDPFHSGNSEPSGSSRKG